MFLNLFRNKNLLTSNIFHIFKNDQMICHPIIFSLSQSFHAVSLLFLHTIKRFPFLHLNSPWLSQSLNKDLGREIITESALFEAKTRKGGERRPRAASRRQRSPAAKRRKRNPWQRLKEMVREVRKSNLARWCHRIEKEENFQENKKSKDFRDIK